MARPRRQVFTMEQYLNNEREGYITNNVSTQRNPAWKPIVDGLAVTILTDDYIPPIILAEDGSGRTVIVDGGSRTTAFKMIKYGNYKIKSSVENPIIKYKKLDKDDNGNVLWTDAEFDIRNKRYENFPKELQKKFNEYQVETVIHECDEDTINMYFRRYNIHTCMNANQKMFIYIPKFADVIREIIRNDFFINYSNFSDNEKEKGMLERVIAESVMCMFHFDKWNKNGKTMATYLNNNASTDEFDKLEDNLNRLESIITNNTRTLFNSRDCFVWLTLFEKFTQFGIDDIKFGDFLNAFIDGLRNKEVDGKLFDSADEIGSTKDKRVVEIKLHILETLMKEYLHIAEDNNESEIDEESFIAKLVDLDKETIHDDMIFYRESLEDLKDVTIKDGSKLLQEDNNLSLLAMVVYSYKEDIDLEEWLTEYAKNNNTYFKDQRKNYYHMLNDFRQYQNRLAVA